MNGWHNVKAEDFIDFNPREHLPQGTTAKKVSMEKLQPFSRSIASYNIASFSGGTKFRNGDTIMARITPCLENGKTAQVNCLEENEVGFGSTEFIVMRAKPSVSDRDFIYYLATSPFFRNIAIQSMIGSSGRQRVQQSVLNATELFVPPLSEQIEIGRTLRSLDDKIENNTKINHHLEQMAQAIFKSWFVDFEPFGGTMPSDWRNGTLSGIAPNIYSGGTPNTSKKSYWNGEIPWLSSGETRNHFIISTEKQITQNGVNNSSTKLAHRFDVVMASAGQGLTRGQTSLLFFDSYINQSVIVMHGNSPFYLFLNLLTRYEELRAISDSSSIRGSITTKMLAQFPMLLPSPNALADFSNTIKPLFGQIENNLRENARLAELRDTLLPRLMFGELSVAELDNGK